MNAVANAVTKTTSLTTGKMPGPLVQRKCGCGNSAGISGSCDRCEEEKMLGVQPKLQVGSANDVFEREADSVASQVMNIISGKQTGHSHAGDNREIPRLVIQRNTVSSRSGMSDAPAGVEQVVRQGGRPLDSATRAVFEPAFNHDFSAIRIHIGAEAAKTADALDAMAYTVGNNIVFGAGNYAPVTHYGQELLAHELTHTIQQGKTAANRNIVHRRGPTAGGFFNNIGRAIASIFGDEPAYDENVLLEYLRGIDRDSQIEDDYDSDNKARAVVQRWGAGDEAFFLTTDLKILLIQEMLSGSTLGSDEDAILALLSGSTDTEITRIITVVGESNLRSDVNGERGKILDRLIREFHERARSGNARTTVDGPQSNIGTTGLHGRLMAYLRALDINDRIQQQPDSHLNARKIIRRWLDNDDRFYLPVRRQQLLVRELLSNSPQAEDRESVLSLLRGRNGVNNDIVVRQLMSDPGETWIENRMLAQQAEFEQVLDAWRQRESAAQTPQTDNDRIDRVIVDQETPQTVTAIWRSGRRDSDICSTGKGHCCIAENDAQGAACSQAESRQGGSNCTPVGIHTVDFTLPESAGGVELWTNFHRGRSIALHDYEPRIDGTPLSHGCVRLRRPMAQLVYDGVRPNHTKVEVKGLARPRCNWPALQAEWAGDLRTAASTVDDGEPPNVRARQQRSIDRQRATEREIFDISDEQLTEQIAQLEQQFGGTLPYASRIWGTRSARVQTLQRIQPIADIIPRCVATQTVEERRLQTESEPASILQQSSFDQYAVPLEQALQGARNMAAAQQVVANHGNLLWQAAVSRAQGNQADTDDRPLYWARLQMTAVIREWLPRWSRSTRPTSRRTGRATIDDIRRDKTRLLAIFEVASRGMQLASFSEELEGKKILISGFDPFGLHNNIDRGNPSGAAVLALDNQTISSSGVDAEVQGVIFPVRFEDFNAGSVETFFRPYISGANRPDMIMTISQGRSEFEVERFAGRRRSSEAYPGNQGLTSGGTRANPVEAPGLAAGPEFIETTLPREAIRTSLGRDGALPEEREVTEIRPGESRPSLNRQQPTPGAIAVRGSGGGFLSNEIFYRTSNLRLQSGVTIPLGHLHTPAIPPESQVSDFEARRDVIVNGVRRILESTVTEI